MHRPTTQTSLPISNLPEIPVVDVRDGGPLRHAQQQRDGARALRDACLAWLPGVVRRAMPMLDGLAQRWLRRSASPYIAEIDAIAKTLAFPGIWFLNGSYQWSCTSCAREEAGLPWLVRTLDWPFPGLGRHVEIARQSGTAGEFWNVTWPGYAGVLTACAPGRFAACINQAPMMRRTSHRWLRLYDLAANAIATFRHARTMPPDQLLRQVLEQCPDFEAARARLESVPVARPVIYTLTGCKPGECCVIERTETAARTRLTDTGAANDWHAPIDGWEGRIGASKIFTSSTAEAAAASRDRWSALNAFAGPFEDGCFGWVTRPVLNPYTRLAVEMCPARGLLRAVGYERVEGDELASPATQPRVVAPEAIAA